MILGKSQFQIKFHSPNKHSIFLSKLKSLLFNAYVGVSAMAQWVVM